MNPGRRPKPDWLKVLDGNPGKRAIKEETVKAPVVIKIDPPARFGEVKRKIWEEVCNILSSVGALASCDKFSIARYVDALVEYEKAVGFMDGPTAKGNQVYAVGSKGKPSAPNVEESNPRLIPLPQLRIMGLMASEMRKFESDFGLNPSARTQILSGGLGGNPPEKPTDDNFDVFDQT